MLSDRLRGFTLVELMVVLAVTALLATVAYPSFADAVRKSRRADAVQALSRVQQAQERWRANHVAYAASLGADGLDLGSTSPHGHYGLAVTGHGASSYTVRATALAGSPQSADARCRVLQVRMDDAAGLIEYGSEDAAGRFTTGRDERCWVR